MNRIDRIKGCLLGGAVDDALGTPVEFLERNAIRATFGAQGIVDYSPGIPVSLDGWLLQERALWSRRAPGNTCLQALMASKDLGQFAENNSKGCGAVMRVAPCAFFINAFDGAADSGRMTHGHPTGYLAAGLFADILQRMADSQDSLEHSVIESLATHGDKPGMEETRALIERVLFYLHEGYRLTPERIDEFGGGWIAEEALAIGIWCALLTPSFVQGVINAVNHSGDSDSTGLIAGHLLGIHHGLTAIPERWLEGLELRSAIEEVAKDIERLPQDYSGSGGDVDADIDMDYPGS